MWSLGISAPITVLEYDCAFDYSTCRPRVEATTTPLAVTPVMLLAVVPAAVELAMVPAVVATVEPTTTTTIDVDDATTTATVVVTTVPTLALKGGVKT